MLDNKILRKRAIISTHGAFVIENRKTNDDVYKNHCVIMVVIVVTNIENNSYFIMSINRYNSTKIVW